MLGVFNYSGGDVRELSAFARLERAGTSAEPMRYGPLAVLGSATGNYATAQDGDVCCAFEGALYDTPDPSHPQPRSPTNGAATVASVYRHAGADAFAQLRGRFVTAVWNAATRQGAVICDLLATRELFATRIDGALIFATELSELLECSLRRPGPDATALSSWLAKGECPDGLTFYDGVLRLNPGELIPLGTGLPEPRVYWRPTYAGTVSGGVTEHGMRLRDELTRAVGKRLSSQSTAVILSGGVDSSVVTAVAARMKPQGAAVTTYSCVFPGAVYDESDKIRAVVSAVGVPSVQLQVEPVGAMWLALEFLRRWQSPLVAPGGVVDSVAAQAASEDGAEIILDGQTGDELFGFSPYAIADHVRAARFRAAVQLSNRWPSGRRTTRNELLRVLAFIGLRGAVPNGLEHHVRRRGQRPATVTNAPWLYPEFQSRVNEWSDRWRWKRDYRGPLWWRYLADKLLSAPHRELRLSYLRHRADLAGLIGDPPLCDVDLITHTLRIPPELAFDPKLNRPVVREAMRGWLPDLVRLQATKANFSGFALATMSGGDASALEHLLLAPTAEIRRFADPDWIGEHWGMLRAGRSEEEVDSASLWRLAMVECWLRTQADHAFAEEMLNRPDLAAPSFHRVPDAR